MNSSPKTPLAARVLASGLVTPQQLETALAGLWPTDDDAPPPAPHLADEQLAARLVEAGHLNRWQADQLLAGRAKFSLGPYRILESIGQGGMGQVFKAKHTIMDRVVAVKVLPRHKSSPEALASFHREIRAQAQLDHENLVRALDAGHDGNVHYLVTEYVSGTDLRRLVRRQGPLDTATAASIIAQAATGLAHAHAKGLIHRDVKPGNILVTPEGRAKVSDLGLADFFDAEAAAEGRRGHIVGTADYLSPEQIISPEKLTPASDMYALGCTLYYAVTGKVPFPGGTTRDKIHAHVNLQPFDPRRLNPQLPDAFVDLIADMMAKDPHARIATGEEVAIRLAPWVAAGTPQALRSLVIPVPPPPPPVVRAGGGSRSSQVSIMPLPYEPPLHDTQPSFDLGQNPEPVPEEAPSQASQSTVPIASADEETVPQLGSPEIVAKVRYWSAVSLARVRESSGLSPALLALVALAAALAIGCLVVIAAGLL